MAITWDFAEMLAKESARDKFMLKLLELAKTNKNIVYICSDGAPVGSKQDEFRKLYPEQFIEVGIAEPNAIGIATGLALSGKMPFVNAFGPFLSLRATDQIHTDMAYNDVPVRVIGTHGGLTSGGGPTHYTVCDYAIMRSIPNMTMVAPSDANQCVKLIEASLTYPGPVYIRVARGEEPLVYKDNDYEYVIGKAITAKEGKDATIIGVGIGVYNGLVAAQQLAKEGIDVRVLDMHTIKPIDTEAIVKAAKETGVIVTVEDHNIVGGLGAAVAEVVLESGIPCKFKRLGVPDVFAELGTPEELYAYYGYDGNGIIKQIKQMLD
ncbi:MAG: transketolase [Firmicutes bacterium]|nr:transketolase [Bacillota bacterium]